MSPSRHLSDFLNYLAATNDSASMAQEPSYLPSINQISKELGVSVASLREQLEVAKALGLVEVKPRTGIRRLPYSFTASVRQSLSYALLLDPSYFETYSNLRNHVEASYWHQAVRLLTNEDHNDLRILMSSAWDKLRGDPIHIPHYEHRQLHITIFSRLNNAFVQGILEAYWDAYEAVELNLYADYDYLQEVWNYHQQMVDAICNDDFKTGYTALVEHKDLLYHRPHPITANSAN
jgi:DNA-binding FadR family transcriptional regulator